MNDQDIIELFWQRSEDAIHEVKVKFSKYCQAIAWNLLGNVEDVEECLNDTWFAAWNRIPPERPVKLAVYLGRITRNIAMDRYDYNHATKRKGNFDQMLSELEECAVTVDSAQKQYEDGETARLISRFLKEQEALKRVIFIRRYWYGDSIAMIAGQFAMSQSKVKSMLHRMRKALKAYLECEGADI